MYLLTEQELRAKLLLLIRTARLFGDAVMWEDEIRDTVKELNLRLRHN